MNSQHRCLEGKNCDVCPCTSRTLLEDTMCVMPTLVVFIEVEAERPYVVSRKLLKLHAKASLS